MAGLALEGKMEGNVDCLRLQVFNSGTFCSAWRASIHCVKLRNERDKGK